MDVETTVDAATFLEQAGLLLARDEARHNLAFGILATVRAHPEVYPEFRGWLARIGSDVVGAVLRTPPQNLIVVRPSDEHALGALADAIDEELPGVVGAIPEVDAFAAAWSERRCLRSVTRVEQRIYALREVQPPPPIHGTMRLADVADRERVLGWFRAFGAEVLHGGDDEVARLGRTVDARLASNDAGVALWEVDGHPVSLAGFGGPTPNGIRIGPVYTPPELRGRGYGTAVTTGLSELMLSRGHAFCFLYTDLANPTSNAIYQRIGYEPVCDSRELAFVNRLG